MKKIYILLAAMFLLAVMACGGGGGDAASSNNTSSQTIDAMTTTMNNGAEYYNDQINSGVTSEEAGNSTIAWLKKQDGVVDAYYDIDKKNIYVKDTTGIISLFITNDYKTANATTAVSKNSVNNLKSSIYKTVKNNLANQKNSSQNIIKSIILDPFIIGTRGADLQTALNSFPNSNVELKQAEEVTPDFLMDHLQDYDIIYYIGHGAIDEKSGVVSILSGEQFSQDRIDYYYNKLRNLGGNPTWDEDGNQYVYRSYLTYKSAPPVFAITSKFVALCCKNLKATVVYIDACDSAKTDTMAKSFIDNGAKSYIGWDYTLFPYHAEQYAQSLFTDLFNGTDVQTACSKLQTSWLNIANLVCYENSSAGSITLPIINVNYSITGKISYNGVGLSGVTVTLTGSGSSSTETDANGYYTFINATNGSYTLSFSGSGYTFNPSSVNVEVNGGNFTVATDIVATASTATYSMSGTIHVGSDSGAVLSGATVSIAGLTATTSSTGTFSITGIPAGTYAFSVSKSGYDTYTNPAYYVGSDQTGLSFYLTQSSSSDDYTSPNIGTLKYVPAGSFQRDGTATNISTVSAFRMSQYEITRAQFLAVMGVDPSNTTYSTGTNDPVQQVIWYHAIAFCNKLSIAEGLTPVYSVTGVNFTTLTYAAIPTTTNTTWDAATANWSANGYRLPTEMEWMWAAMGATSDGRGADIVGGVNTGGYTKGYAGSIEAGGAQVNIGDYAWTWENSSVNYKSQPVGTKLPNELGLYDMSGNVLEWNWDGWDEYPTGTQTNYRGAASGTYRVIRGGSWYNLASLAAVGFHGKGGPFYQYMHFGFRVVRP